VCRFDTDVLSAVLERGTPLQLVLRLENRLAE